MRILIQTFGSAGDFHPFLAIARSLRAQPVLFGSGHFAPLAAREGIPFVATGTPAEYRESIAHEELWHPRKGIRLVLEQGVQPQLEPTVEAMLAHVRDGETLVLAATLGLAGRIVAEMRRLPLVIAHLAPSVFRTLYRTPRYVGLWCPDWMPRWYKRFTWRMGDMMADPLLAPAHDAARVKRGLPTVRGVFGDWLHAAPLVLGLYPEWFGPRQPDWPGQLRMTGFPLYDGGDAYDVDADLDAWLAAGEPPVVFTAGSANLHGHTFYRESLECARRLGRRALLVTQNRGALPAELPAFAYHSAYAPFGRVLPRAAALVSHGGIGTCAQALAAGIPHLACPLGFDQLDNASRLVDLGTGASLPSARYRAARATQLLQGLLSSEEVATACRAARERMAAARPVEETCRLIEGVLAHKGV